MYNILHFVCIISVLCLNGSYLLNFWWIVVLFIHFFFHLFDSFYLFVYCVICMCWKILFITFIRFLFGPLISLLSFLLLCVINVSHFYLAFLTMKSSGKHQFFSLFFELLVLFVFVLFAYLVYFWLAIIAAVVQSIIVFCSCWWCM